jgi:hypothetical protein
MIQSGFTARCDREQVFCSEVRQALGEQSAVLQCTKAAMSENVIEEIKGEVFPDFYTAYSTGRNRQCAILEP